jgi:hypothetical protein
MLTSHIPSRSLSSEELLERCSLVFRRSSKPAQPEWSHVKNLEVQRFAYQEIESSTGEKK